MNLLNIHIISFIVMLHTIAPSLPADNFTLITTTTQYVAGSTIIIEFTTTTNKAPLLYVSNSFGSTVVTPTKTKTVLRYTIPKIIADKSGVVHWRLLATSKQLQGEFNIMPQQKVSSIQSYLGPPSIVAGGKDFSMLVTIPTDAYDNPLADNTKLAVKHQFLNKKQVDTVTIKNSISYKNIFSPKKTGRIALSASCLGFNSKEFSIDVMPSTPNNFTINYKQHHKYADGNQITTFETSVITDEFQNIVSDGTYVTFFITTANTSILKTSGTTLNGVATASIIHPDHADSWSIQAFIEGMASSNNITIDYSAVISDFDIVFANKYRDITVGPLKSFMQQMIPDGLQVTLEIYNNTTKIREILQKTSAEGYVHFTLKPNQFPKGNYTITVIAAGISKSVKNITL